MILLFQGFLLFFNAALQARFMPIVLFVDRLVQQVTNYDVIMSQYMSCFTFVDSLLILFLLTDYREYFLFFIPKKRSSNRVANISASHGSLFSSPQQVQRK